MPGDAKSAAGAAPGNLSREAVRALLEALPVGVVLEDAEGRVLWCNAAVQDSVGVARTDLEGMACDALPAMPGAERVRCDLPGEVGPRAVSFFVPAAEDAGVRESLVELLDTRVGVDAATGALDGPAVRRAVQSEVTRSRRYGNPLSVVAMSVRAVGDIDEAMAAASRVLRDQLRWADVVGRLDDGLFLLVLPETELEAAGPLEDKIRAGVSASLGDACRGVDFGAATWRKGDDANFVLERALDALAPESAAASG